MAMSLPDSGAPSEREIHRPQANCEARRGSRAPSPLAGTLWFGGWLFTVGFTSLAWWKAILAVLLWPYFLGVSMR